MVILEDLKEINDIIKDLALFVQNDETIKSDFEEYIKTVGNVNLQSACFTYIFERNLNNKSILTLYLENTKKVPASSKKIIKALMKSISSIFEVKKVLQNGFELNNIINEKIYNAVSLVKMTSFRGIGSGQYVVARIFKFGDVY